MFLQLVPFIRAKNGKNHVYAFGFWLMVLHDSPSKGPALKFRVTLNACQILCRVVVSRAFRHFPFLYNLTVWGLRRHNVFFRLTAALDSGIDLMLLNGLHMLGSGFLGLACPATGAKALTPNTGDSRILLELLNPPAF